MEALLKNMAPNARDNAKHYVANKEIPQLFEVGRESRHTAAF